MSVALRAPQVETGLLGGQNSSVVAVESGLEERRCQAVPRPALASPAQNVGVGTGRVVGGGSIGGAPESCMNRSLTATISSIGTNTSMRA